MGGEDEDDPGDEVDQAGEDHLHRVEPLELVVEAQGEDGQHHDPLGGPEVAAVDAAEQHPEQDERDPACRDRGDDAWPGASTAAAGG